MKSRMAVLIDGDNISAEYAKTILSVCGRYGRVDIARVYFNARNGGSWLDFPGVRAVHAGIGKNASDLLLTVDAMEIALARDFDIIAVASSDGDFSHLVQRLRERGVTALGLGEPKAPASFRANCSEFIELCKKAPAQQRLPQKDILELDHKIRAIIAAHSKNGAGMRLAELAPKMHRKYDVKISSLPERTWRGYLNARPELFELDPKGPDAMVRFKVGGFG